MPVTVLGADGTGQDSEIIEGVVYAAEHDADVILMAFSNPGYSEMLQAAIDYAWDEGAVLVAATGNDGSSAAQFPAGDRGVIGVSNTDQNDALNGSSNYGQDVFLGAPGTGIATTSAGGGYTSITGTSASAAEVAGAAALIKANSGASNGVIVSRLAKNAEPAGTQRADRQRAPEPRPCGRGHVDRLDPARGRRAGRRRRPLRRALRRGCTQLHSERPGNWHRPSDDWCVGRECFIRDQWRWRLHGHGQQQLVRDDQHDLHEPLKLGQWSNDHRHRNRQHRVVSRQRDGYREFFRMHSDPVFCGTGQ